MITTIENRNPVRQVVGDDVMADGRLTWAARGMFLHLAQLPNGTVISRESLSHNTATPPDEVGRTLTILRETGYIQTEKQADGNFIARLKPIKTAKPHKSASVPAEAKKIDKEPILLRAEKLLRRLATTPQTAAERNAFLKNKQAIAATSEEDWRALERFYAAPQQITFSRKSLDTLYNNWNTEIEKARLYDSKNPAYQRPSSVNPTVFKVGGREFTLANPPKLSDFSSPGEYETYLSAYNSWKRAQS